MIQKTFYCCEICGAAFLSSDDCEEHEASHYNLSPLDYQYWKNKMRHAIDASKQFAVIRTSETRQIFESQIQVLTDFEKSHDLEGLPRPSHFLIGG